MNVLVIDIGGTHVKILASGHRKPRKFESGPTLTPAMMVSRVQEVAKDWSYDAVCIGYPGPVCRNHPVGEPRNLGKGWVAFDFRAAFQRPVKIINDAAMQALGSYKRGRMLFIGLGTGLGAAMIVEGVLVPMELGSLPCRKGSYEDHVGIRGLEKYGKAVWRQNVAEVVKLFIAALQPSDVVLGGGNVHKLADMPPGCRIGSNANAFRGGFRLCKESLGSLAPRSCRRAPRWA